MATTATPELKVFYCYAREDQEYREKLDEHMANLKRRYHLKTWADREILPGENWEAKIEEHLKTADLIFLLISPAFMNSDYCYNTEMTHALTRHQAGEALVIPIIVRRVHWEDAPFSTIQVLPTDALPISRWSDLDDAFYDVVVNVERVIKNLLATRDMLWNELQRYEEAITAYDHAIRLNPDHATAYYNKGNALDELQRYDEAIAAYDHAIYLDPNDAAAYYNKGNAFNSLKRYDEALLACDHAIRLDPNYANAYYNKGVALQKLGRQNEAQQALQKARESGFK